MTKKNVVAIIPAREKSKRVPKKNYKFFNGKPMIAHTIEKLIKSKIFDRIIVSTDAKKLLQFLKSLERKSLLLDQSLYLMIILQAHQ